MSTDMPSSVGPFLCEKERIAFLVSKIRVNVPTHEDKLKEKNNKNFTEMLRILQLNTPFPNIYNQIMSILQHDDWYSENQRQLIQKAALECKFWSSKQLDKIKNPPKLCTCKDNDSYSNGTPDGMTHEDWEEYCDRQD